MNRVGKEWKGTEKRDVPGQGWKNKTVIEMERHCGYGLLRIGWRWRYERKWKPAVKCVFKLITSTSHVRLEEYCTN